MSEEVYDSTEDTTAHINQVTFYLGQTAGMLYNRSLEHDQSKLVSPEKEGFDRETPNLRNLVYGSPEYNEAKARLGETLEHHYRNNSHHPEYYAYVLPDGSMDEEYLESGWAIASMSLLDIIEMLVDWKAASERHATGNIKTSIEKNIERFGIDKQLASIIWATAQEYGWVDKNLELV